MVAVKENKDEMCAGQQWVVIDDHGVTCRMQAALRLLQRAGGGGS